MPNFLGRLILVRHAMPVVDPAVPSDAWRLDESGRSAARALRPLLPSPAHFVASSEPKAHETLQELADDVLVDPGFREAHRPWATDYRPLARGYVEGAQQDGWEPQASVVARFNEAVARHTSRASTQALIIGTHGIALTLWLASVVELPEGPARFWESLRFPDIVELRLEERRVHRLGPQ